MTKTVQFAHGTNVGGTAYKVGDVIALPDDVAASVITAGYAVDSALAVSEVLSGSKTAPQGVNNSAALVNATGLVVTLLPNLSYLLEGLLPYDALATADIQFKWSVPAGASMLWALDAAGPSAAAQEAPEQFAQLTEASVAQAGGLGATKLMARVYGRVTMGATGGPVQLQFAQAVAVAGASTIGAGAFILATR